MKRSTRELEAEIERLHAKLANQCGGMRAEIERLRAALREIAAGDAYADDDERIAIARAALEGK